jgi:hypothetical protein
MRSVIHDAGGAGLISYPDASFFFFFFLLVGNRRRRRHRLSIHASGRWDDLAVERFREIRT